MSPDHKLHNINEEKFLRSQEGEHGSEMFVVKEGTVRQTVICFAYVNRECAMRLNTQGCASHV